MYRKLSDFVSDYLIESQKTVATINAIPTEFLDYKVDPQGMSLSELAFHIAQAIEKITTQLGFEYSPSILTLELPKDSRSLLNAYERTVARLMEILESKSDDSYLEKYFPVYGTNWSIGHALSILLRHEVHHRAQIIVGLRVLGQTVPDIYGPARR